ncbi:hypothetical protein EB155_10055, partial [archaeon]|nr:hypothetical protein [archaeon]
MLNPYCIAPWKALSVDFDGNVFPDGIYKKPLGNLHVSSISEMWNNSVWRKLRQDNIDGKINDYCLKCANKEKLSGHSRRMFFETFFGAKLPKDELQISQHWKEYESYRPIVYNDNPDIIYLDITTSNKC